MSLFWKIVDTLDPDPSQAQVIIGLGPRTETGANCPGLERLLPARPGADPGKTEAVLVVATSSQACQETVLRLSELGVSQLHAIYPQDRRPARGRPGGSGEEGSR